MVTQCGSHKAARSSGGLLLQSHQSRKINRFKVSITCIWIFASREGECIDQEVALCSPGADGRFLSKNRII